MSRTLSSPQEILLWRCSQSSPKGCAPSSTGLANRVILLMFTSLILLLVLFLLVSNVTQESFLTKCRLAFDLRLHCCLWFNGQSIFYDICTVSDIMYSGFTWMGNKVRVLCQENASVDCFEDKEFNCSNLFESQEFMPVWIRIQERVWDSFSYLSFAG